jgi:glycosyltransferase involved in cell wall biosynthesis
MSTKKKILLLTDWYEPGYKAGGPVRSCANFASVMRDDYSIYVLTSDRDLGDTVPYVSVEADKWVMRDSDVQVWYSSPGRLTGPVIVRLIREIAPDFVYLNSMYSWRYTILPLLLRRRHRLPGKWLLAPRGMLQQGAMQFKSTRKRLFLGGLKGFGVMRGVVFQATDEQERLDIRGYFPTASVVVLPNFSACEPVAWAQLEKLPGMLHCVFISRLAPKKNLLFLLQVLQDWPATSSVRLTLRGEVEDQGYWEKCQAVIRRLPAYVSVRFEGAVPNTEVIQVLQQHHIFVLPTLGENFGHAIFEAMLAGKPVVISDKTPWSRLEAKKAGHDLPLEPAAFARVLEFYASMDQIVYDEWSRSAWEYARSMQDAGRLKEDYKKLLFT